jgi:Mg/Co/Ni transporter MgtE
MRARLDPWIDDLAQLLGNETNHDVRELAGMWNYVFTRIILRTSIKSRVPGRKYWVLALVCGVLVTMIFEFYRRVVAPYEDEKVIENGDVY